MTIEQIIVTAKKLEAAQICESTLKDEIAACEVNLSILKGRLSDHCAEVDSYKTQLQTIISESLII